MRELREKDVEFESMRAGGPGGQHADRRATAVRLRIPIEDLPLSDSEKTVVRNYLPPKNQTKADELIVESSESRSQKENRKRALKVAVEEIEGALDKGVQNYKEERHKQQNQPRSGGGGGGEADKREIRKKRRRSETTEDLLEEAFEEDPDSLKRFFEENDRNGDD